MTYSQSEKELGGKAFHLNWLRLHRFAVPKFKAIKSSQIRKLLNEANLFDEIEACLHRFVTEGMQDLCSIQDKILSIQLTEEIRKELHQFIDQFSQGQSFAVRSSAVGEDSKDASFAGQMDSFLFQSGYEQIEKSFLRCIASFYNTRALKYRQQWGYDLGRIDGAVIIQEMIESDVSGVFFTAHPVSGDRSQGLISSCYGVGEGIVSGVCMTDDFSVDMKTGDLIDKVIAQKDVKCVFSKEVGQGTREVDVPQQMQNQSSLTDEQLKSITKVGFEISSLQSSPQDIEWAIRGDKLYILQTRPVTHLPKPETSRGRKVVWDNSNIQESYNGVTTPLTFSFASRSYKTVYTQTYKALGVSQKIVNEHQQGLDNLLGLINGRVYYNINNWYQGLSILPSFGTNKEDMERMMGLQDPVDFVTGTHLSFLEKIRRVPGMFRALWSLVSSFRVMDRKVDEFFQRFDRCYRFVDRAELHRLSVAELIELCRYLDREMLFHWTTPIMNDFYVMMMNGKVHRQLSRMNLENPSVTQNNLMAGEEGIESTEPTKFLLRICDEIRQSENLRSLFNHYKNDEILDIAQDQEPGFYKLCQEYIELYGDRSMGELKLESRTLRQDASFMFAVMRNYLNRDDLSLETLGAKEKELRSQAEHEVHSQLSYLSGRRFKRDLQKLRDAVKFRENMRMTRTRLFGLYRSIFREIGTQLYFYGQLEHEDDVFYLTVDEIYKFDEGRSVQNHFKGLVSSRKDEFESYESEEPPHHFVTYGPPSFHNIYVYDGAKLKSEANADGDLMGIGCYPGVVEQNVKIIERPEDDLDLKGQILCTVRTDPGWAPLFPTAGGILVERGSTLSHSAVVARELGIPAVVGVAQVTKILQDGESITLDGAKGTVRRHKLAKEVVA